MAFLREPEVICQRTLFVFEGPFFVFQFQFIYLPEKNIYGHSVYHKNDS